MKTQSGAVLVEFALIALLFFTVLFFVIEAARAYYTFNTLTEMTRRGVRAATVCPPTAKQIIQQTLFNDPYSESTHSQLLPGVTSANVKLRYLKEDGSEIPIYNAYIAPGSIPNPDPDNNFNAIKYVSVKIINYQHRFIFPPFTIELGYENIDKDDDKVYAETILPRESLGAVCRNENCSGPLMRNHCPFP